MKTISSKPSIGSDSFQLTQLLATNKSLAQEKRQVHRQKLRQYSEKAVKLKDILRSSTDQSQRKCLQGKLRALEQKQNAQINKLSKIDQIEKEIDQYMYEQDQDHKNTNKQHPNNTVYEAQNEYTPAKRLKKKLKQANIHSDQMSNLQSSIHQNNLFGSSHFNMGRQRSDKKIKPLKMLNQNQLHVRQLQKIKISKESRAYSCWEPSVAKQKPNPLVSYALQEHQPKFSKNKQVKYQQERLSQLKKVQEQKQKIVCQLQNKMESMIQRERDLMQRIDCLQKEYSHLVKKTSTFVNSINRSKDIILSSGLLLQQLAEMQTFANFKQKSSHQFSIDSLESHTQSGNTQYGVSVQLSNFQRLLEQFLLSAERVTMITSGELQQCGLKVNRMREDYSMLQAKKKNLQAELMRCEQNLITKKKQFKNLQESLNSLNSQMIELDQITEVKKKLISQLQQKCQKMKSKKKTLAQKLQRAENEFQNIQQQYPRRLKQLKEISQKLQNSTMKQQQMEQSMIFSERKLQSLKKSQRQLEALKNNAENKLKDATVSHQNILIAIGEDQKLLVGLKSEIKEETTNLSNLQERVNKMEKQLRDSTQILDQQEGIISSQNQQINSKSNELLDWQKKIIAVADSMRAIQQQNLKLTQTIKTSYKQIDQLNIQKQQTQQAKEELQDILREIISKKQTLLEEVELRSQELSTLLTDMMDGHNQLTAKSQQYIQIQGQLKQSQEQLQTIHNKMEQTKEDLQELMQEQANIIGRINRLKQIEKQMLLQVGLKGPKAKVDEQLKVKIAQAVADMQMVDNLKSQLKECKYENRKLKLDNQRLSKLVQIQPNNDRQYKC